MSDDDHDRQANRVAAQQMWDAAAPGWAEHATFVDARGHAVTEAMLDRSGVAPGHRVLELACGPGGVGLAAAARVGPSGAVVLSDLAPEMTAIATDRAAALGLRNVTVREAALDETGEADAAYDVVLCREGLMLVDRPDRAAAEMRRVLRPDGTAAVAVWGERTRNPWLGALFDAVTAVTGLPVPPPGVPGPFSLDDAELLGSALRAGGFAAVSVEEVAEPLRVPDLASWWRIVPSLAGPLALILASLDDTSRVAIRDHASASLAAYAGPDGVEIPGVCLLAVGRAGG